jgi:poly-beta-1,6-N-acetyl-D-glucosamine synthase
MPTVQEEYAFLRTQPVESPRVAPAGDDPSRDSREFLLPAEIRPRPTGVSRPDPGPLSSGRLVVIGALYALGLLMALLLGGLALWEFIAWGKKAIVTEGTTIAWIRFAVAKIALFYAIRWVYLMHATIMDFLDGLDRSPPVIVDWPLVTVLLPAYNEQQFLSMTIESVLALDYPNFELLIVDDGSTDATLEIARRYEGRYEFGPVRAITKPNGGKWTAHNFGFRQARGEFVMCIDADSRIDQQALRKGVEKLLSDPKADAVAGYTRVMQRHNFLLLMQTLEFVIWNGALRMPQSRNGAVTCIPGPMGLFRREAMQQVYDHFGRLPQPTKTGRYDGPFEGDTFAEDFDLTIAIQLLGGKVLYDPLASCDADCPTNMLSLLNQRYRWSRGSLQVLRKVISRCWKTPAYRNPAMLWWLGLSYGYDVAVFLFAFVVQITLTLLLLGGSADLSYFLFYFLAAACFKFVIAIPFLMVHRESPWYAFLVPFFDIYGSYILGGAFVISAVDEIRNASMDW